MANQWVVSDSAKSPFRARVVTGTDQGVSSPHYFAQGQVELPNEGQVTDVGPSDGDWQISDTPPDEPAPQQRLSTQLMEEIPPAIGQFGLGALKGLGSDVLRHTRFAPYVQPKNELQTFGRGAEQAAEFLLPGFGEDAAASALAEYVPQIGRLAEPVARLGISALGSGAVNEVQGGSFGLGTGVGLAGGAAGEGMRLAAPGLTEFAQGIHTPGRKTGRAILSETRGITPAAIRKSAQRVLGRLNPELEQAAIAAPGSVSLLPARQVAQQQLGRAFGQGEPRMYKGVKRLAKMVNTDLAGQPLPEAISPYQALELKRGVGKALPAGSWNPQSANAFKGPRDALYHVLNEGFENAVPEAAPLNRRSSALIPASKPGRQVFGHVMGPGAGAILGGYEGAMFGRRNEGNIAHTIRGGLEGAALGGLAGLVAPTALNAGARSFASPVLRKVFMPGATGGALQLKRVPTGSDEPANQVWAPVEGRDRKARSR